MPRDDVTPVGNDELFRFHTLLGIEQAHNLWGPRWRFVCWFKKPSNYSYLRTRNHSYWTYLHQVSYRLGAPHCMFFLCSIFPTRALRDQLSGLRSQGPNGENQRETASHNVQSTVAYMCVCMYWYTIVYTDMRNTYAIIYHIYLIIFIYTVSMYIEYVYTYIHIYIYIHNIYIYTLYHLYNPK